MKKYRSFTKARNYVRLLKLNSSIEWEEYCKSGKKPDDIPVVPRIVFKERWKGFGDWLGTGRIANQNRSYLSFTDARRYAQSLNLNKWTEWQLFCKSDKRPDDIPSNPERVYKKDWIGMYDWLGTSQKLSRNRTWRKFTDARRYAQSLNLADREQWIKFYKSDKRPDDIPSNPERVYKKDWIGWGDFLGNRRIRTKGFRKFTDARRYAQSLNLNKWTEWQLFCKSDKRPDDIPVQPHKVYKNKGWIGMYDWLGTSQKLSRNRTWRKFTDAKKFVQSLNLENREGWNKFCKSKKRPLDIPVSPERVYRKEWKGFGDWLGTGNVRTKEFWSFIKARVYVRKLGLKNNTEWSIFRKSDKRPEYIPSSPQVIYKNEFVSIGDWLGTNTIANQVISAGYLPPQEAGPIIRKLREDYGLKNKADWVRFTKTHKKILEKLHLPADPVHVYSLERAKKRMKK